MFEELLAVIIVIIFFTYLYLLFIPRKSKSYRRELADMYVACKIKYFAKKDNFDLEKEFENFKDWLKKEKTKEKDYSLDDEIEESLKERIEKDTKTK